MVFCHIRHIFMVNEYIIIVKAAKDLFTQRLTAYFSYLFKPPHFVIVFWSFLCCYCRKYFAENFCLQLRSFSDFKWQNSERGKKNHVIAMASIRIRSTSPDNGHTDCWLLVFLFQYEVNCPHLFTSDLHELFYYSTD